MAIKNYNGHYPFTKEVLDKWSSAEKGVYYLGTINPQGQLAVFYIGKGAGEYGIRGRLYDHLEKWRDITHFGYQGCDWDSEVDSYEMERIKFHRPKYNVVGL